MEIDFYVERAVCCTSMLFWAILKIFLYVLGPIMSFNGQSLTRRQIGKQVNFIKIPLEYLDKNSALWHTIKHLTVWEKENLILLKLFYLSDKTGHLTLCSMRDSDLFDLPYCVCACRITFWHIIIFINDD